MDYMIWFDNNGKKTTHQRVDEGANYFERKYGRKARVCLVNPEDLSPGTYPRGEGIRMIADRRVMKNYFWLGEEVTEDAN